MRGRTRAWIFVSLAAGLLIPILQAAPRLEFTRMVAHWADYADPGYLPFLRDIQPEVVQVGFYGAHFWGLVDTPYGGGYPAHFPVRGHAEGAAWFAGLNEQVHGLGAKVIGHLNVKFLVGDPEGEQGPRGFFHYYRHQWDDRFGPKPVADPLEFLEKDKLGNSISNRNYSIGGMGEYWACLNNPHWREVLKCWVRFGIAQGVDGFMVNYFYRHDCHCAHCVDGFKRYLRGRFSADGLKERFGIADLESQVFEEIGAWHDPEKSTPLRREALRFSQMSNKEAFDEVFVRFGRSLKPDLIAGQWNHMGDFNQISGDERCLLPAEDWGRDEDYLWYSTGGVTNPTDLKEGNLGEATLQMRYIRGAFDDKPFTLGRYEDVRIRSAMAELAANGGAPLGFYARFTDPEARLELVRYYNFLRRHESLYRSNRSHAEALLLFPRSRVHQGDLAALQRFKDLGRRLLEEHVLFDILPDDVVGAGRRAGYGAVYDPGAEALPAGNFAEQLPRPRSLFLAPATVRVSASRPESRRGVSFHFVNYNREEPADPKQTGGGIQNEKPIPATSFPVDLLLPPNTRPTQVTFLEPESVAPRELEYEIDGGRLKVQVPGFLVYGVLHIELSPSP